MKKIMLVTPLLCLLAGMAVAQNAQNTFVQTVPVIMNQAPVGTCNNAAFQLAWTRIRQADRTAARALFDRVAASPGASPTLQMESRWNAAKLAESLGEVAAARVAFAAILRDCGDGPAFAHIRDDVRARLGR